MRRHAVSMMKKSLVMMAAATGAAVLVLGGPAAAAINDSFSTATTNGCGAVAFVDYGAGAPGSGSNDDYIVIHDYCPDGHGVEAYAWLYYDYDINHSASGPGYLGKHYNGNGVSGSAVVWDPFKPWNNVHAGDRVGIKVCLVDGPTDKTPSKCTTARHTSADG